jgi:ABC-type amino acid transport substrate-binding protein
MQQNQKSFDIPANKVRKLLKLNDSSYLFFGMNLNSDPALVAKLQSGVDKLRNEGKINAIVQQYMKLR